MNMSINIARLLVIRFRKDLLGLLFKIEAEQGKMMSGLYVEGSLEAAAAYLQGSIGKEAAYNTFQRQADKIAGGLLEHAARHQ